MLCEETRQSLSSYLDDGLSLPTRVVVDQHLDRCPVCRAELSELRSVTRSLGLLARPLPPPNLAATINDALLIESAARRQQPDPSFMSRVVRFLEPRLMPYTIGTFASVLMFALMFAALRPHFVALREAAMQGNVIIIDTGFDLNRPVSPADFAASRAPFAAQSPSLNPVARWQL